MQDGANQPVYNVWLRFSAIILALALAVVLVVRSFLQGSLDPNLPWNEEFRILKEGQTVKQRSSAEQTTIGQVLRYKADAEQGGSPRGQVNILIYPDGIVKGVWNGEYDTGDGTHCLVMAASFKGNIDPTKPYPNAEGKKQSQVYFITKGTFVILETRMESGKSRSITGYVYVRGWLEPDYTAVGEVVVTENRKTCEIFSWGGLPAN